MTGVALDSKRLVKVRVAALVELRGRGALRVSARDTAGLRSHAVHRLATAAVALQRMAEGRAEIRGRRVAVVGASLSAGVGGKPLAVLLKMALPADAVVVNCADMFTYERPQSKTGDQIRRAQEAQADVILALDMLFWFAYHNRTAEAKRAYVDSALKVLDRVKVPLLLGDLPDMRSASEILIPRSNLPSAKLLRELNLRIRAWARARLNVHVLPFAAWAKPLLSKGRIVLVPSRPPIPAREALHLDGLHPNGKGALYLLNLTFGEIHRAFPRTSKKRFRVTPQLIELLLKL